MRILITNDDGIHAEGLKILEEIAHALSDDIWVVAPEKDQSGVSHSCTISDLLRIRKIDERHFSIYGTPSDCVVMAIKHILPQAPDIVLSGVNAGGNIAYDVTYSGTVAAALEATLLGVRSFALSQNIINDEKKRKIYWETAKEHAPAILQKLLRHPFKAGTLTNINFPACQPNEVTGVEITQQGVHLNHEIYIDERFDNRHFPYYWLRFVHRKENYANGSDAFAITQNKISITPLHFDLTAYDEMKALFKIFD